MKKLKINELEVGKIYKFYFYDGARSVSLYKVNKKKQLCITEGSVSTLKYNDVVQGYFVEFKREIDWTKVPRGTKVQVSLTENGDWFNRYFIDTGKKDGEHAFVTSLALDDDFTSYEMEDFSDGWEYCRIHESVEIPDEWYKEVRK